MRERIPVLVGIVYCPRRLRTASSRVIGTGVRVETAIL
jgi:hypothetical protein